MRFIRSSHFAKISREKGLSSTLDYVSMRRALVEVIEIVVRNKNVEGIHLLIDRHAVTAMSVPGETITLVGVTLYNTCTSHLLIPERGRM